MLGTFGKELAEALDVLIVTQMDVGEWAYDDKVHQEDPDKLVPETERTAIPKRWKGLRKICEDLVLSRSVVTLNRLLVDASESPFKVSDYRNHLSQLDLDVGVIRIRGQVAHDGSPSAHEFL